ncbi:gamma-glutamyltransferase 2. Threonine peptidase. MEROPS family T03 [Haloplanus vescus]|uniref:Gamma-glutamyltransferase 2. Threonine peptidase. MEROPS family T03 n=1 Tax=Haloplanus vescus TaxID=555874 RepID=A0A1H3WGG5_9EURY|nr:gamma-glutamyltransferase [Haloplanus vescus]SDZ85484.1 gamma-glutamyltransferase 2. Threonine peptidase. MEROPS family T03 [Haloplanus vescus]
MDGNPDLDRFDSRRSTAYAQNGMVATSQPLAAQAGVEALRDGGNAFDAAVTTAAALNVVEPMSTGIGGDAFALYRTADGDVGAFRSCGGAPADATRDAVRRRVSEQSGVDPADATMPGAGPLTVTVPGTVRGWDRLLDDHGERSLAAALEPAIEYATEGFPVSEVIADMWTVAETLFTESHAREEYLLGGRAPDTGDVMRLPDLGGTLSTIATEGADAFYEGPLADHIAEAVRERGGLLSADDLADFEPEYVNPVSTTYRGAEIYELPPNNQGLVALEALNIAEELDAGSYDYDSAKRVHYFAESLKRAFHDGHHYITDPEFEDVPALGSKAYAAKRATTVGERAGNVSIGGPGAPPEDGDTVLLTVADDEGNVVSFINSIFGHFGSGVVVPETGITLQNRGSSFTLDPEHPNRLEPGKRPFHTLIPGLARFDDNDWAAFGVMGGYMQPQGHLQVLSNLLDYDMPLQAALDAPRWRYLENGSLAVEDRFPDGVVPKLVRRGHDVVVRPPSAFGGGEITRLADSVMSGATEPRKDGTAAGF